VGGVRNGDGIVSNVSEESLGGVVADTQLSESRLALLEEYHANAPLP
jgi:hypothetical protein